MAFGVTPAGSRYTPVATVPIPGAATGVASPAYKGTFIPEIWSSKLIDKYYDATVLAAIANTDYEGEISAYGDTIHIRTRPTITIRDYLPDSVLQIERPGAPKITMEIDQAHYFNLILDDIYEKQSDIDQMNLWAEDASEQMKTVVDQNVLASIPVDVAAGAPVNVGATAGRRSGDINLGVTTAPVALVPRNPGSGETEIIDHILDLGQVLDEQNVPESGRFLIVPSWTAAMVKKSELRDASLSGDGVSMLRNGRIGMIDRFTLFSSNLMPTTGVAGEHYMIAGTPAGLSFAAQMTEMETLRSEFTFGGLMRGLFVYGFKMLKPENLAISVVTKA